MTTTAPSPEPAPRIAPSRAAFNRPVLIIIAVLIALLLAVNGTQLVLTLQQNAGRAERAQAADQLVQDQQSIISGLISDYERAAYNDPNVETIYQQQLIASESILQALHIMAIQNSQIIGLLAVLP
jgi:long-subunit fatty acid transport protein